MKDDGRNGRAGSASPQILLKKTVEEQQDKEKGTGQQWTSSTHQRTRMDE
jgi:hypothetical protein